MLLVTDMLGFVGSSVDEAGKQKLEPFSSLSSDESYQNRDLEKVYLESQLQSKNIKRNMEEMRGGDKGFWFLIPI